MGPKNRFNLGVNYNGPRVLGNLNVNYAGEAFWNDVLSEPYWGTPTPTPCSTRRSG